MKFFFNQKKFQIILFSFFITTVLFLFKVKKNNFRKEKLKRNLFTERNIKKICSNTNKSFFELYGNKYYIYYIKIKTKYVNYMIDFIKDNDSKYIKKYLPRIGIYLFFLALDISFIFLWLSFCICCCCPCCCFSSLKKINIEKNKEEVKTSMNENSNSIKNNDNNTNKDRNNITNNNNENNNSNNKIAIDEKNDVGNNENNNFENINNSNNNNKNNYYENNENQNHLLIQLIIALLMNIIIIICIIILLSIGNNIKIGSNSTTCSILNLYTNLKNGETIYNEKPKWEGIETIQSLFNKLSNQLINIKNYYPNMTSLYYDIKNVDFYSEINNYTKFISKNTINISNYYILNPDIREDSNTNITVDYIYNYNETINLVFNDYNISLYPYEEIILNLNYILGNISENSNLIKDNIDESNKHLDDIMSTFDDFSDKIIDKIVKYQNKINNNYKKIYYPIFSIFLIFPILSTIGLLLVFFDNLCMRILLHIVFQFQSFFTLIICLIGVFLGIISIIGKDLINVFNYSISTDNLKNDNPIIIKGNGREYLNTCFNLNGDLSEVIGLNEDSKVNFLNELYLLDDIIKNKISLMKSLTLNTDNLYNEYNKNYFDITNINYYINDTKKYINDILIDLRKFTDASFNNNYILENNTKKTYHMWVFNESRCENDYLYSINYNEINNLNEKMCFVFSDFDNYPDYYYNIYCDYSKSNFNLCSTAFESYFERLKIYINDNKNYLYNISLKYEEYSLGLKDIKSNISNSLNESLNVTNILSDIFSEYLNSNNALFDLLNCEFINRDINIFYYELDKNFNKKIFELSTIILIISCASMINILFIFIFTMKSKIFKEKDDNEDNNNNALSKFSPKNTFPQYQQLYNYVTKAK